MPYLRRGARMRRGVGQLLDPSGNVLTATYNAQGQYQGGSTLMDIYCGSVGSWIGDPTCSIPTPAQIAATQTAELATTSAPPAAQAAAVAAGNAAVATDMAANPSGYLAQCAASLYPGLSSAIGPGTVASLFGIQTDCSQNLLSGSILWVGVGVLAIWLMSRK
jgi:hypothetical protein